MPRESTNSSLGSWFRQWSIQTTSLKPGTGHAIQRVLCVIKSQKCGAPLHPMPILSCTGYGIRFPRPEDMLRYNKIGGWLPGFLARSQLTMLDKVELLLRCSWYEYGSEHLEGERRRRKKNLGKLNSPVPGASQWPLGGWPVARIYGLLYVQFTCTYISCCH